MVVKQLPVLRWGHTLLLFEQATEIHGIIIADDCRDLTYIIVRGFQQADRIIDTIYQYIVHGRHSRYLLKIAQKPADAHAAGNGKLLYVYSLVVMLIEISAGVLHFLLKICTYSWLLFQAGTLDKEENLTEIHGQ